MQNLPSINTLLILSKLAIKINCFVQNNSGDEYEK
jgi:hypothetical protein